MRHTRTEVIERTIREFERLDDLVSRIEAADWQRPTVRRTGQDPWTVKDALAHIIYWKADTGRRALGQRRAQAERGLDTRDHNHLVYEHWRDRTPAEVVEWHRQVQEELRTALANAPDSWFNGKEHTPPWPADLDGHSAAHRVRDIEKVLLLAAVAARAVPDL